MIRKLILILALIAPTIHAQTFFKVAKEGDKFAATNPLTYRYGIAKGKTTTGVTCPCWSPSVVTKGAITTTVSNGVIAPVDPAPGLVKELDILETSVVQSVTVNGATVVIPAAPVVASGGITVTTSTISCAPPAADKSVLCTVVLTLKGTP